MSCFLSGTTKCSRPNGSPKGNPEGLGEMMKRVLHAVQLAVPIGIICIRLAQDFAVVMILIRNFRN